MPPHTGSTRPDTASRSPYGREVAILERAHHQARHQAERSGYADHRLLEADVFDALRIAREALLVAAATEYERDRLRGEVIRLQERVEAQAAELHDARQEAARLRREAEAAEREKARPKRGARRDAGARGKAGEGV